MEGDLGVLRRFHALETLHLRACLGGERPGLARTLSALDQVSGHLHDQDGYRGEHGIEDTRMALIEARHRGIHPCCITIHAGPWTISPTVTG